MNDDSDQLSRICKATLRDEYDPGQPEVRSYQSKVLLGGQWVDGCVRKMERVYNVNTPEGLAGAVKRFSKEGVRYSAHSALSDSVASAEDVLDNSPPEQPADPMSERALADDVIQRTVAIVSAIEYLEQRLVDKPDILREVYALVELGVMQGNARARLQLKQHDQSIVRDEQRTNGVNRGNDKQRQQRKQKQSQVIAAWLEDVSEYPDSLVKQRESRVAKQCNVSVPTVRAYRREYRKQTSKQLQ